MSGRCGERPSLAAVFASSAASAMDIQKVFESLQELSKDGFVEVSRMNQVLTKIGMEVGPRLWHLKSPQVVDAEAVVKVMEKDGKIKLSDFVAWVSGKSEMTVPWTDNIILATDSYKFSHWKQYPPGTEYVYSYFESRGCERGWNDVVFFGLQYFLKRYLLGPVITQEKIDEAATMCSEHFVGDGLFYKEGFQYILEKHGGKLPISIKALPEGMVVPTKTCLFTMVNTDPKCYWLTNFLETLLVQVWYPMTVCSNSRYQKLAIHEALEATGNEDWAIPGGSSFKLHDFGFRGVSSVESAALGGAAHLANFLGTDTVAALLCTKRYYGASTASGFSIPASEHSTITSWGVQSEVEAMRNMLQQYPKGLVACVSDSFDVFKACKDYWGDELKDLVKGRISESSWGRLVVRPDSGDPCETCVQIISILAEQFKEDVITTKTGHKLLPAYLRVIQGDGVDYESVPKILQALKDAGFAADNIAFGSGGALLQKLNRDTFKCPGGHGAVAPRRGVPSNARRSLCRARSARSSRSLDA